MNEIIRQKLLGMGEEKLKKFSEGLIPGAEKIIGIRLPALRKYAKETAAEYGISALDDNDVYYEETMLRGMVIGYLKTDFQTRLGLIAEFVKHINNWAVCDSFCSTLRFKKKELYDVWQFLQPYLESDKEFEARFGAVMLLDYYITDEYIDKTLQALVNINTEYYYSSMGTAWALAECYIHYPEKTLPIIKAGSADKQTHNRAIQKICDSHRITDDKKEELRKYRKK